MEELDPFGESRSFVPFFRVSLMVIASFMIAGSWSVCKISASTEMSSRNETAKFTA